MRIAMQSVKKMAGKEKLENMGRRREDILRAIQTAEEDPTSFLLLNKENASRSKAFSISEFLQSLPNEDCTSLWPPLLAVCLTAMDKIVIDEEEEDRMIIEEEHKGETINILEGVLTWTHTYITCLEKPVITEPLIQIAMTYHDVMLKLSCLSSTIQNSISLLCESWWIHELQDKEMLVPNTVLYTIARTLWDTAKLADVKRVWSIRGCLLLLDFEDGTADSIKEMLLMTTINPLYLKSEEGYKFISYLFGLHPSFVAALHDTIKLQLPGAPRWLIEVYSKIYYRAWRLSEGPYLQQIETHCLQDLMYTCLYSSRQKPSFFHTLQEFLSHFHQNNTQKSVQDMLYRLYKPFLWRSLGVANPTVRANAVTIMLDVFPLYDPESSKEDMDKEIQRQFDLIKELLKDPAVLVRSTCIVGVCRVLSCYWEMIPTFVIKDILTIIISELAFDVSSSIVRTSVFQGLAILLEQRLSHPLLKELLPLLGGHLHDTSDKVRLAFLDVLILVKNMRSIKYWTICPVDHLLARMEQDDPPVVQRIVALLLDTFQPTSDPSSCLKRCFVLVRSNPLAAWQFYYQALSHMTLKYNERFILALLHCVVNNIKMSSTSSTGRKKPETVPIELPTNDNDDDSMDTESVVENDEDVLTSLLEVAVILWEGFKMKLKEKSGLKTKQKLMSEVENLLPHLVEHFKNNRGRHALYLLGSFLPKDSVGSLVKGSCDMLAALHHDEDPRALLAAMFEWGQEDTVVKLVEQGLMTGLQRESSKEKENTLTHRRRSVTKFNGVTMDGVILQPALILKILNSLMTHPVFFDKVKDLSTFWDLNKILQKVLDTIEHKLMSGHTMDKSSQEFLVGCLSVHIRVAMHRNIEISDRETFITLLEEILGWCERVVFSFASYSSGSGQKGQRKTRGNRKRKVNQTEPDIGDHSHLAQMIIENLLTVLTDMMSCGLLDSSMETLVTDFTVNMINQIGVVFYLPLLTRLLYQLVETGSCIEVEGIVSPSSLLSAAHLLESILIALNKVSETQPDLLTKTWSSLKPALNKALVTSQHHSSLSVTLSIVPIFSSLVKATLIAHVNQLKLNINLVVPSDISELPRYVSLLVGLGCRNKISARLFLTHMEHYLDNSTISDLLLYHFSSLHIVSATTNRPELVDDLLHFVHTTMQFLNNTDIKSYTSEYSDLTKTIQELSSSIQQSLLQS